MNDRIKELAINSELAELYDRYVHYCFKNADDEILDFDTVVGGFAELIVKECAEAVKNSIWSLPRGYNAADQAAFVKKHFGVEE